MRTASVSTYKSVTLSGEIHVWTLRIPAAEAVAAFEQLLSSDERERAARFRFDHLRRSFVITRGALRCLLARYVGQDPAAIHFVYGPKGKPALGGPIEFNTTHSGDMAAFAFADGCPVGIDLEQIRAVPRMEDIAARFFEPEEHAAIMALPPAQREAAFFRCWTRKEACVKATGEGLGASPSPAAGWTLCDLAIAPGYAGALAYRDRERSIIDRQFPAPPAS